MVRQRLRPSQMLQSGESNSRFSQRHLQQQQQQQQSQRPNGIFRPSNYNPTASIIDEEDNEEDESVIAESNKNTRGNGHHGNKKKKRNKKNKNNNNNDHNNNTNRLSNESNNIHELLNDPLSSPPPPLLRMQSTQAMFLMNYNNNNNNNSRLSTSPNEAAVNASAAAATTTTNENYGGGSGATLEDFQLLLEQQQQQQQQLQQQLQQQQLQESDPSGQMIDINATAEDGNTPLAVAAFHGDYDVCKFLLQNGADPNLATVQGAPPLYWASSNGHSSVIQILLEYGANPNAEARDGLTPLICAAVGGHSECCHVLLEVGNALPNLEHKDTQETALYGAAQEGHVICLTWLLEYGADPNKANRVGETPLFWAARNGHANCVQRLLEFQADPDLSTWDKQTPLYWACVNQNTACVELLLKVGEADPNICTKAKLTTSITTQIQTPATTPLEAAIWNNDQDIITLLLQWGAQEDLHRTEFVSQWMNSHKGRACPDFVGVLLNMDLTWASKQLLLENALRYMTKTNNEQVLLKILHSRLGDLSRQSSDRRTIFLLMFDFYVYIAWLYVFAAVTLKDLNSEGEEEAMGLNRLLQLQQDDIFFQEQSNFSAGSSASASAAAAAFQYSNHYLIANLACVGLVFFRECLALRQQGRSYFSDLWNWVDMSAMALVATACILWLQGETLTNHHDSNIHDDHDHDDSGGLKQLMTFQKVVISAGAFLPLSFIGYLKSTFLPFSNFVGGVSQIMRDLFPFIIVTSIIIVVFAFMFYIQEFGHNYEEGETDDYKDLASSVLTVFSQFVGDPRKAEGFLDIIFGLVVAVVLLNVVIAIVSASWENAVNTSLILLCRHRLQLLRRANDNSGFLPRWFQGEWWIDHKFEQMLNNLVDEVREEYDFWVGYNPWHPTTFLWSFLYSLILGFRPVMTTLMWILGAITFGLMWPESERIYLFGIKPGKDTLHIRMERMEEENKKMASRNSQIYDVLFEQRKQQQHRTSIIGSARGDEIQKLHEKIDSLQRTFTQRMDRTSQAFYTNNNNEDDNDDGNGNEPPPPPPTTSRTTRAGSSNNYNTAIASMPRVHGDNDETNESTNTASNKNNNNNSDSERSMMTIQQMEKEMQILHTKIDLVLEYVMSASATDRVVRQTSYGYSPPPPPPLSATRNRSGGRTVSSSGGGDGSSGATTNVIASRPAPMENFSWPPTTTATFGRPTTPAATATANRQPFPSSSTSNPTFDGSGGRGISNSLPSRQETQSQPQPQQAVSDDSSSVQQQQQQRPRRRKPPPGISSPTPAPPQVDNDSPRISTISTATRYGNPRGKSGRESLLE